MASGTPLSGRPPLGREITELIVRMARENGDWGYDRIAGALAHLGHHVSDQTVGNILRRFGIPPAPKRRQQMNWTDVIRAHMAVLASIGFLTVEVLTWRGLANLLCAVLSALGDTSCHVGWNNAASDGRMDGANGSAGCRCNRRHLASDPFCFARS
jgi:hypothetical protein